MNKPLCVLARAVVALFFLSVAALAEHPSGWIVIEERGLRAEGPAAYRLLLSDLLAVARAEWPAVVAEIGVQRPRPVTVVLVPEDSAPWPLAAWIDAQAPAWAVGYAPPDTPFAAVFERRWPSAGSAAPARMAETMIHELAHVAIYQVGGSTSPKWFQEGVASLLSLRWRGWSGPYLGAAELDRVPPLGTLKTDLAYWAAHDEIGSALYLAVADFARWASAEHGEDVLRRVLARVAREPLHLAWYGETGERIAVSEARWRLAAQP